MTMSRRKQLHPKSFKEDDEIQFVLPDEFKYDEKSNEIITRKNLKQNHRFGPFPALLQIEDRTESFQLLDIKHNWLIYCSILNKSSGNLTLIFQNNQLFIITKESIPIGTQVYLNKIILPKLNMNKDIQIKNEPLEIELPSRNLAQSFLCNSCGIEFSHRNTLDAHRQHYCMHRKSHSTNSSITIGVKRKSSDSSTISAKRLSNESYCSECDILFSETDNLIQHKLYYCQKNLSTLKLNNKTIPFNRPIQIGQFIYVPIPISPPEIDNKPLDLSKPKKRNNQSEKIYPCQFCSIRFHSLKTLDAHLDNYCLEYQKQKTNRSNEYLLKCQICLAMFNNEEIILNHMECVHTNGISSECLECRSRFSSKWNLIQHMKVSHIDIKSNEEEDQTSDSMNLTRKILIKSIQKSFSCQFCYVRFGNIETLKQHMKSYCSSRPIPDDLSNNIKTKDKNITYCSSCQISFQYKTSYDAHKMYYCRDRSKTNVKISA